MRGNRRREGEMTGNGKSNLSHTVSLFNFFLQNQYGVKVITKKNFLKNMSNFQRKLNFARRFTL